MGGTWGSWNELMRARWEGSASVAVVDDDLTWSGDELLRNAGGASVWLDALGVPVGRALPALVDESPTAIALAVGAAFSGRALAPLGTKLPVADLALALEAMGSKHLVAEPRLAAVAHEVAAVTGADVLVLERAAEPAAVPDVPVGHGDVGVVVHTSGTTGRPKPVDICQGHLLGRVSGYGSVMGVGPGDRYCSASPFYHTAGVTMALTVLGLGVAVIPQDWFSLDNWRRAGRLGMTCALLVPTMVDMLLASGALADATPRVLQYGAAPMDPGLLREALAVLPDTRFLQIFGQTEASPLTALVHEDHMAALEGRPELLATVGRALPNVELLVDEPDEQGIGELLVRGPQVSVVESDGWRHTGDLGDIDADGYVRLRGRRNDRILRGGENIYPAEVEAVLATCPGVREVAVVGVPDRRWGEVVKAVVVAQDPAAVPSVEELQAHAAAGLARFKVPAIVEFATELPRTPTGKLQRNRLVG